MTTRTAAGRRRSGPARLAKTQRQHLVAQLLVGHEVASQEQLVSLLGVEGVAATQATTSRDLEDLGAIKVRSHGGELIYAIPELPQDQRAPDDRLRRALVEWVVQVDHSANVVVLRTPPGTANVVGSALDRAAMAGVLGTVAGDDTLLVIATEDLGGIALANLLRDLAGLG